MTDEPNLVTALRNAHANFGVVPFGTFKEAANYIDNIQSITAAQADDDGLWFEAETAPEAYLQQELRKLHAAIEGTDDFGFPLASVSGTPPALRRTLQAKRRHGE